MATSLSSIFAVGHPLAGTSGRQATPRTGHVYRPPSTRTTSMHSDFTSGIDLWRDTEHAAHIRGAALAAASQVASRAMTARDERMAVSAQEEGPQPNLGMQQRWSAPSSNFQVRGCDDPPRDMWYDEAKLEDARATRRRMAKLHADQAAAPIVMSTPLTGRFAALR